MLSFGILFNNLLFVIALLQGAQHVIVLLFPADKLTQIVLQVHLLISAVRNDPLLRGQHLYQIVFVCFLLWDVHKDLIMILLVVGPIQAELLIDILLEADECKLLDVEISGLRGQSLVNLVVAHFTALDLDDAVLGLISLLLLGSHIGSIGLHCTFIVLLVNFKVNLFFLSLARRFKLHLFGIVFNLYIWLLLLYDFRFHLWNLFALLVILMFFRNFEFHLIYAITRVVGSSSLGLGFRDLLLCLICGRLHFLLSYRQQQVVSQPLALLVLILVS
jgi:hypothetical protein